MGLIGLLVGGAMDATKAIKQNNAKNNNETQHVEVNNLYAIDLPAFLSKKNNLSEDASLQYGSVSLDIYFQVIDEPKDEFIETVRELEYQLPSSMGNNTLLDKMAALCLSNYFDDMDKVEIGNYTETSINGLKAVTLNAFQKRTFFKDAMYTSFAFIEGKNTLYQIIILSGGTSISKLADKLETAIYSFKEL